MSLRCRDILSAGVKARQSAWSSFGVLNLGASCRVQSRGSRAEQRTSRQYSTNTTQGSKRCQFCGATCPLASPVCTSCASPSSIPDSVSFYDHFPGLAPPPKGPFKLDVRKLRREFIQVQQKVHPDHFSNDEKKRLIAEGTSSLLNKAYTTLQQPLARAEYLLHLNGVEVTGEGEKLTDNEVLMTVMEAQESIEEARSEADLVTVKEEAKALIEEEIENLSRMFANSQWAEAKESAVKLRYWLNIQKSAMDWEPGSDVVLDH